MRPLRSPVFAAASGCSLRRRAQQANVPTVGIAGTPDGSTTTVATTRISLVSTTTTTACSSHHHSLHQRRGCFSGPSGDTGLPAWATGSKLPPPSDPRWAELGNTIVSSTLEFDMGPEAFHEVLDARRQLEVIVQSCGYDLGVYPFGGVAVMGILEVGGDVDFSAVAEEEPSFDEASDIVARLSREMRRLGLRCSAIPRARVPVVKVDRASHALPGSPLHINSSVGLFQFARPLTSEEQSVFMRIVLDEYHAVSCEWDAPFECATIQFQDSTSLIVGLTHLRKLGSVDIPLRIPVDTRQGPELYRFPFDFCLSSTGLRNSYLLGEYLVLYPYARHLALALKRWGRSSGVVSSMDGLLASYALTVMLIHYLAKMGVLPQVETSRVAASPHLLPKDLQYRPLAGPPTDGNAEAEMAKLGYLFANFFEYYSNNGGKDVTSANSPAGTGLEGRFNFESDVVCTTESSLQKTQIRGWEGLSNSADGSSDPLVAERPPFYHFCVKDPFSHDNVARNLGREAVSYVQQANRMVVDYIHSDLNDPKFMLNSIMQHGPRPKYSPVNGTYNPKYMDPSNAETTEAFRKLKKMEFHRRQDSLQRFGQNTMRHNAQAKVAQSVTRGMLSWLRDDSASVDAKPTNSTSSGDTAAPSSTEEPNNNNNNLV